MPNLYEIACNVLNSGGLRRRASSSLINRITERWEIVYSAHLGQYGNAEREGWTYLENHDDYFPEDSVVHCDACQGYDHEREARGVYIFAGSRRHVETWCSGCVENDTFCCERCEETISSGDMCTRDDGDRLLCPRCDEVEQDEEDERGSDEVRDYHSTRRPSASTSGALWSIEIEMEFPSREAREAFAIEAYALPDWQGHRLIIETDGSLDRSKGAECILSCYESRDALLRDIHALQAVAKRHKAIAWDLPKLFSRDAGIHISTNRIGWNTHSLMRLGYILTACSESLKKAAGRSVHFAEFPQKGYGLESRNLRTFARGYMGKYSAVNLQSSRLEWRIFRSTLNPERITNNLALVCRLEDLAKSRIPAVTLRSAALAIIQSHTL